MSATHDLVRTYQDQLLAGTHEYDEHTDSFALARDGVLASFGGPAASAALMARLHEWIDIGMPCAASMPVRAYRAGHAPRPGHGEFLISRGDTDFLWSAAPAR